MVITRWYVIEDAADGQRKLAGPFLHAQDGAWALDKCKTMHDDPDAIRLSAFNVDEPFPEGELNATLGI